MKLLLLRPHGRRPRIYGDTATWFLYLRLVSVITFLAERGLAFRGNDQIIGSPHNGNYLGLLELISENDPFLALHIQTHGNKGKGHTNYACLLPCVRR